MIDLLRLFQSRNQKLKFWTWDAGSTDDTRWLLRDKQSTEIIGTLIRVNLQLKGSSEMTPLWEMTYNEGNIKRYFRLRHIMKAAAALEITAGKSMMDHMVKDILEIIPQSRETRIAGVFIANQILNASLGDGTVLIPEPEPDPGDTDNGDDTDPGDDSNPDDDTTP